MFCKWTHWGARKNIVLKNMKQPETKADHFPTANCKLKKWHSQPILRKGCQLFEGRAQWNQRDEDYRMKTDVKDRALARKIRSEKPWTVKGNKETQVVCKYSISIGLFHCFCYIFPYKLIWETFPLQEEVLAEVWSQCVCSHTTRSLIINREELAGGGWLDVPSTTKENMLETRFFPVQSPPKSYWHHLPFLLFLYRRC